METIQGVLKGEWPATLAEWDQQESIVETYGKRAPSGQLLDEYLPEPASFIQLGHAFPSLKEGVPTAFYHISRLPVKYDDKNRAINGTEEYLEKGGRLARRSLLTRAELETLYFGSDFIKYTTKDCLEDVLGRVYCDNRWSRCGVNSWLGDGVRERVLAVFTNKEVDVLKSLSIKLEDIPEPKDANSVCYGCKEKMRLALETCRQRVWDALPNAFKPDPWDS